MINIIRLLLILLFSASAFASDGKTDPEKVGLFLFATQLSSAIIAKLASESPEAFGAALVAGSAAKLLSEYPHARDYDYINAAGIAGLGVYNMSELRKDKYSRTEKFQRNMVGLNILIASTLVSHYFLDDSSAEAIIVPTEGGALASFQYRF